MTVIPLRVKQGRGASMWGMAEMENRRDERKPSLSSSVCVPLVDAPLGAFSTFFHLFFLFIRYLFIVLTFLFL
ncbi:hypothetical protein K492DRAFT_54774 [Lichtheimia hyalospora FSU 10163]|nr:hypothetical protein K492DRAFT_54774 [Lichtheimia hyalospora FSU 10163]